jgi:hypothetical protein
VNIAGNRQDVADKFWSDVEKLLTGEYQRSPKTARRGIDAYRQEVDSHKLGEVIFNQGEEQAARVVDGLIEHGNPIPNPA